MSDVDRDLQGAAQATALAALALDRAGDDVASALALLMGAITVVAGRAGDQSADLLEVVSRQAAEAARQRQIQRERAKRAKREEAN